MFILSTNSEPQKEHYNRRIDDSLVTMTPAVLTLFTGNLWVKHPLVIINRVSLLQIQFVHLIISEVGVIKS